MLLLLDISVAKGTSFHFSDSVLGEIYKEGYLGGFYKRAIGSSAH